jgi:hypothetical protein
VETAGKKLLSSARFPNQQNGHTATGGNLGRQS